MTETLDSAPWEAAAQNLSVRVPKPWGFELLLTPRQLPYTAKLLFVHAGARLSLQTHTEKVETLCLVRGRATLLLEGEDGVERTFELIPHRGFTVARGRRHRVTALADAVIFEASTAETGATLRIEDDYARGDEELGSRI